MVDFDERILCRVQQGLRQVLGGSEAIPIGWERRAEVVRETARKVLGVVSRQRKEGKETWL